MKIFSLGLIVVILNIFIWVLPTSSILEYGYADLTMLFETLPYAIMFLIPSITMNLVVEDFEKGTSELLFSKPLSIYSYWWAAFVSGTLIILLFLGLTFTSYFSITHIKSSTGIIDRGQIMASYLGIFFISMVFLVIGLFCSSFSKSQTAAFLISIISCYSIYVLPGYLSEVEQFSGGIDYFMNYLSLDTHYYTLGKGILEVKSICYVVSLILLFSAFGIRKIHFRLV